MNIIEELSIKEEYYSLAKNLCEKILLAKHLHKQKSVIAIGGESGSGKSTTALCLQKELAERNVNAVILHMDSYFKLPPKDNHQNRLKSLENVGPHEVNMVSLNEHIFAFKNGQESIQIPIVNYKKNNFSIGDLGLTTKEVLIVEGVYSLLLDNLDHKIFIERSYLDSLEKRMERTRESYDPYVELILEIEHKIVAPLVKDAAFIIDKNYAIK